MRINQIYIFRFIAALLVVFFHFFTDDFKHLPALYNVFKHGDEAVSFFFALSGFIMVVSYGEKLNNKNDRHNYWIARIARIFPLYIFALAVFILYYYFVDSLIASSVNVRVIPEALMVQSWLGKTSLNFPGWSLSAEMFFYLLFPFVFVRVRYSSAKKIILVTTIAFVLIQLMIFTLLQQPAVANNEQVLAAMHYSPYCHLITFFAGVSLGLLYTRHYNFIVRHQVKVVLSSLAIIVLYSYIVYLSGQDLALGILTPVYCLFILAISTPMFEKKILTNRFSVFLGDISYGIYILQYPVFLFAGYLISTSSFNEFFIVIYIAILIAMCTLTFFLIEKPGATFIKKSYKKLIKLSSPQNSASQQERL